MIKWAAIRQRGRQHFLLTRGLLLYGLPLGTVLFLAGALLFEPPDLLRASLYVPGFLVFGWLYGDYVWHRREKAFESYLQSRSDYLVQK